MPDDPHGTPIGSAPRFIGVVFGVVFAGIGLTVLGFMWFTPRHEFGAPPLFFRIFASFIAIPFVAIGGTLAYKSITGKSLPARLPQPVARLHGADPAQPVQHVPSHGGAYRCPRCGAPLGKDADVSPSGDVKCTFCNTWFNIHRATT